MGTGSRIVKKGAQVARAATAAPVATPRRVHYEEAAAPVRAALPDLSTMTKKERRLVVDQRAKKKQAKREGRAAASAGSFPVDASWGEGGATTNAAAGKKKAKATGRAVRIEGNLDGAEAQRALGRVASAVASNTTLKKRQLTSTNLGDRKRAQMFAAEVAHVKQVQQNASFQVDPLAALQAHLSATAQMLRAPNAEMRRPPPSAAAAAGKRPPAGRQPPQPAPRRRN
jgi:hypothetical protein